MTLIQSSACTHPGLKRDLNEDRVWSQIYSDSEDEPLGLFVVCDGMGGHLGGDSASKLAVETVKHEFQSLFSPTDPRATILLSDLNVDQKTDEGEITQQSKIKRIESVINKAIQRANQVIYEFAKKKPQEARDAGTTITMAIVSGKWAVIANIGDSRTYLLRDQKLQQITKDHSLVASLVERGQIQPDEIFTHPQRNLIYRSLGNETNVEVDTFLQALKSGDYLILCSDGLWEMIQDEKVITRIVLDEKSLEDACLQLITAANDAGGEDNIGIVLVKIL